MTTPDGPFWELVKAEFRATWCGELRWLWRGLVLVFALATMLLPAIDLGLLQVYLLPMSLFVSWTPMVLGSDLLSLTFPGNPEPQRPWPFRAVAARGLGRLLPWLLATLLLQGCWMVRFGVALIGASTLLGTLLETLIAFQLTALVSAALRRPRRLLVVGLVHALLMGGAYAYVSSYWRPGGVPRGPTVGLLVDPLHIALIAFCEIYRKGLGVSDRMWFRPEGVEHLIQPGIALSVAFVLAASVWLIVERRIERNPYSTTVARLRDSTLTDGEP